MSGTADPSYDIPGALDVLMPGIVVQRALIDAAASQYAANGYTPLLASQVPAILTAAAVLDPALGYGSSLPAYPAGLPRFADSNPSPGDGWVEFGTEGPGQP